MCKKTSNQKTGAKVNGQRYGEDWRRDLRYLHVYCQKNMTEEKSNEQTRQNK